MYVLVTSCDPLRAFMYKDGLVRLSTTKYHTPTNSNIDQARPPARAGASCSLPAYAALYALD